MANSDIKLLDDKVEIIGDSHIDGDLTVTGKIYGVQRTITGTGSNRCIDLDTEDVRISGSSNLPHADNVALSNGDGNKLIINRGNGYTGGVSINGGIEVNNLKANGEIEVNNLKAAKSALGEMMLIQGNNVIISTKNSLSLIGGDTVSINSKNLVIDNKEVQEVTEPSTSKNIALSHEVGDRLIINRGKGYQGGVEIEGSVNVKETLRIGNLNIGEHSQGVVISAETIKVNNVKVEVSGGNWTNTKYINIDLVHEILKLQKEIKNLKKKVSALES